MAALVADDYGLTPGVCEAILDAFEHGPLTSTSVLVNAPAFSRYADNLASSGIDAGLHVAFVGEDPPVLSAKELPTLLDRRGKLPSSWRGLAAKVLSKQVNFDELTMEAEAQLEKLKAPGVVPGHMNTHQHTHLLPSVAHVLCALAQKHSIPTVRVPETTRTGTFGLALNRLSASLRKEARAHGLFTPAAFLGLDEAGSWTIDAVLEAVSAAGQTGTLEIGLHPGLPFDPERTRYRWTYNWAVEHQALMDPQLAAAWKGHRVDFVGLADMAAQSLEV